VVGPYAVLLAAAEGGGGGLTDIDTTLFWATLVMFALFAFVLGKFAWGPLLGIIEEREKSVRSAVDDAHKANQEAQELLEKHKALVRDAGRERDELIKKAIAEADQIRSDLVAKARSESEQLVERARGQIEREKSSAIQALRAEVADLAVEAAAKIVTSSMSEENQRKLVDDFIAGLPKA
jgi:F-type H+-transporting ATPase subunit b